MFGTAGWLASPGFVGFDQGDDDLPARQRSDWLGLWRVVRYRASQHSGGNQTRSNRIVARPAAGAVRGGESRRAGGEQVGVSFLARPAAGDGGGLPLPSGVALNTPRKILGFLGVLVTTPAPV